MFTWVTADGGCSEALSENIKFHLSMLNIKFLIMEMIYR